MAYEKLITASLLGRAITKIKALIPSAASSSPVADGTAAVGSSAKYAREDHVHPHDSTKVDKVSGKGLSTNDFTDALESKLTGIATGAEVNVQSDWSVTDSGSDAFIKNKPTIPEDTWKTYYGTCATAAATKDKAVTVSADQNFKLRVGAIVGVKFSYTNTYSSSTENPITLNVNGTGAKNIWYNTTHSGAGNTGTYTTIYGVANRYTWYMYDGTYWVWIHFGVVSNSNTIPSAQCETAAATAAKFASCTNHTLTANTYLLFNIRYANTVAGAITMNVDSSGAKPVYINDEPSSASNHTLPAGTYIAFYNGTNWYFRTDGVIPGRAQRAAYGTARRTSANIQQDGVVGVSHFIATASMSEGKPAEGDGHIVHMSWDNTGGYDSQLYIKNTTNPRMRMRGQSSGTWGDWITVYSENDPPPTATQSSAGMMSAADKTKLDGIDSAAQLHIDLTTMHLILD